MCADSSSREFGPWNPGIKSQLPREYLPFSTMFRPENVATSIERALEMSDFCGIQPHQLVAFRAERLIVHELLIRVTADLAVPDGPNYEDLGINFRQIASRILAKYISPHQQELVRLHAELRERAAARIAGELSKELFAEIKTEYAPRPWYLRLAGGRAKPPAPIETIAERERRVFAEWGRQSDAAADPFDRSCFRSLIKIAAAIAGQRGRLIGDKVMIADMAATLVSNELGSAIIGEAIDAYIREAAGAEGYRLLPAQDKTVIMNVKGASASGKSTLRPLQRRLAERLDIPWADFALISPDIWRKFLLDYDSLGAAFKYAGTLTGQEVEIIDKKLDQYMSGKAAAGKMSHLLIDRFRFDSFVAESDGEEARRLLTRFGDLIYMFFMITPPEATVERAWLRGLKIGRYKSVDDLLDHNIEAYTGMPQLFFTWAARTRKRVHYEFLDNSVAEGTRPRTVAYGWNGDMTILDIKSMLDVDRFRKINIHAKHPGEVYRQEKMEPASNAEFLKHCARMIPAINFADCRTGRVYGRLQQGQWVWRDAERFASMLEDADAGAGLRALGSPDQATGTAPAPGLANLEEDKDHTLGAWGRDAGGEDGRDEI
jgi:hypothetical protein